MFFKVFAVAAPKQAIRVLPCLKLGKLCFNELIPAGVKNTKQSNSFKFLYPINQR